MVAADGHSDFEAIRTKAGGARATYVALIFFNSTAKTFGNSGQDRRAELERIVKDADAIMFNDLIAAEGELVFRKACELGMRGHRVKTGRLDLLDRSMPELDKGEEPRFQEGVSLPLECCYPRLGQRPLPRGAVRRPYLRTGGKREKAVFG